MVKVNVATWNVCGISSEDRKLLVAKDIDRYNLDIIALQETKTREFAQITLPGHHHLYLFDQKQDWHGCLGFVINKRFTDCIMSYHQISDRVAYIDTKLKPTDNSSAPCYIRFINCYSPTNPKSVQNPQVADKFYDQLEKASDVPARYEVWFLGDFNAKLGKRSWNDEENGLSSHIGKYGVGRRNENGDRLLQFLVSHTLFAANTAFQHASRHITTRTGWIKDQSTRKSRPYNKSTSVFVHNEDNQFVNSNVDKCNIVRDYFKQHYTSSVNEPALEPFIGPPQPLTNPITVEEVEMAAKKLKNNKALGPDGIPNEFLKYASPAFYSTFAELINQSFEKHEHVPSFTEGYLTPLQKPGKPRGPPKSLRPLCLLNGTRKILSMIVLRRIQGQIAHYTGPWQNAYKPGHSTANIVWTQRMLLSVVKEKHWSLYKMGIDMTSAFDTIKRSVLLDILREAGCSEDDLKLVRYLLSNTKLKIKIEKTVSGEFIVLIGAFQGDSLSGNLFTVYLAGALYHLRAVTMHIRLNPPISDQLLPLEWEYADDADFVDEEEKNLQALLPICKDVLQEWNLLVNESKTEFTQFYIAGKNERDEKGELLKNREPWRSSISLGSKLCDKEDIQRRCTLGNVAFQDYKKVWEQGQRICLSTRLKIYESLVVSVMLYNCNSWAVPKNYMDKIDICHRKHLRQIVKMTYPTIISNEALYKKCNSRPLSERVAYSRWKMFGHILRSTSNSPAVCSLFFAVNSMRDMKGRVGRHQCNLLKTLKNDLSDRDIKLVNTEDIYNLIFLAQDRLKWRKLFKF